MRSLREVGISRHVAGGLFDYAQHPDYDDRRLDARRNDNFHPEAPAKLDRHAMAELVGNSAATFD
jgi:hypothetical protein